MLFFFIGLQMTSMSTVTSKNELLECYRVRLVGVRNGLLTMFCIDTGITKPSNISHRPRCARSALHIFGLCNSRIDAKHG